MKYVRHPQQPEVVDIYLADGIFIKKTTFPAAGMIAPQHAHEYSHPSVIAAGSARVEADGIEPRIVRAGDVIKIEAKAKHLFHILEPGTVVMCVHNADRFEAGEIAIHDEHHIVPETV